MMNSSHQQIVFFTRPETLNAACSNSDAGVSSIVCTFDTVSVFLSGTVVPALVAVGGFGNCVTAAIFLFQMRRRSRQNVYLGLVAIGDTACLLCQGVGSLVLIRGLHWWSGGSVTLPVINWSDLSCRVFRFCQMWLPLLANSLFLAMTADRTLSLFFPFRFRRLGSRFAFKVCACVAVSSTLVSADLLYLMGWSVTDNGIHCVLQLDLPQSLLTVASVQVTLFHFPPTLVILAILIFNIVLALKIVSTVRRRRLELSEGRQDSSGGGGGVTSGVTCAILSFVLVVCSLPCTISGILFQIFTFEDPGSAATRLTTSIMQIAQIPLLLNQSVNWMILCLRQRQFRSHVTQLLLCKGDSSRRSQEEILAMRTRTDT